MPRGRARLQHAAFHHGDRHSRHRGDGLGHRDHDFAASGRSALKVWTILPNRKHGYPAPLGRSLREARPARRASPRSAPDGRLRGLIGRHDRLHSATWGRIGHSSKVRRGQTRKFPAKRAVSVVRGRLDGCLILGSTGKRDRSPVVGPGSARTAPVVRSGTDFAIRRGEGWLPLATPRSCIRSQLPPRTTKPALRAGIVRYRYGDSNAAQRGSTARRLALRRSFGPL